MKLSRQEKAARRAAFRNMSPGKKWEHVNTYYKVPILLGLIALVLLGSLLHRRLTQKEPLLYLALVNVAVGEDLESALNGGVVAALGADVRRQEVYLLKGLYLSEDAAVENHEYAYASRMKLMGSVNAGRLDLVLMNREGYDLISQGGYLLPLPPLLQGNPSLSPLLEPLLTENEVVLSDNAIAFQLGEAEAHEVITETAVNAFDLTATPLFQAAGFSAPVYLGLIANSPRLDTALACAACLAASAP